MRRRVPIDALTIFLCREDESKPEEASADQAESGDGDDAAEEATEAAEEEDEEEPEDQAPAIQESKAFLASPLHRPTRD
jgi:hypothetical protein